MLLEDIFSIVDEIIPNEKGCKIWPKGKVRKYGVVRVGNKIFRVHRLMLQRKLGRAIKPDMCCLHSCDVPECVNPDHLWEGTQLDNIADRFIKKRSSTTHQKLSAKNRRSYDGRKNPNVKLSEADVTAIRSLSLSGELTQKEIGNIYGIANTTVSAIKTGTLWKRVTGIPSTTE